MLKYQKKKQFLKVCAIFHYHKFSGCGNDVCVSIKKVPKRNFFSIIILVKVISGFGDNKKINFDEACHIALEMLFVGYRYESIKKLEISCKVTEIAEPFSNSPFDFF